MLEMLPALANIRCRMVCVRNAVVILHFLFLLQCSLPIKSHVGLSPNGANIQLFRGNPSIMLASPVNVSGKLGTTNGDVLLRELASLLQNTDESGAINSSTDMLNSQEYIEILHNLNFFPNSNDIDRMDNEEMHYLEPISEDNTIRNVLLLFGYTLIMLVALIGNTVVCFVIFSTMKLRTTTNMLITSLSISDIITSIFNIPFNCARIMLYDWPFPDLFCMLMPTVQVTSVYVSTISMAAIGVHRYRSVRMIRVKKITKTSQLEQTRFPILVETKTRVIIWIILIWALSILLALPHSAFNQVVDGVYFNGRHTRRCRAVFPVDYETQIPLLLSIEATLTQFLIPLSITGVLYRKIAKIIQRQGQLAKHFCDEMNRRLCEVKRKRIVMLILIVMAFVVSWLPLTTYHLLNDFHILPFNYTVFLVLHLLAMSSICHNPFIYWGMNTDFRRKAKSLMYLNQCVKKVSVKKSSTIIRAHNEDNSSDTSPQDNNRATEISLWPIPLRFEKNEANCGDNKQRIAMTDIIYNPTRKQTKLNNNNKSNGHQNLL